MSSLNGTNQRCNVKVTESFIESYKRVVLKEAQSDLFPDDFVGKDAELKQGETSLPNINSHGRQISPVKQILENFWRWFGKSKAKDDKGRPLVFFHGTNADFNEFKVGITSYNHNGFLGASETVRHGIFVTPDLDFAHAYTRTDDLNKKPGANIVSVYVKAENPFDLSHGLTNKQEQELSAKGFNTRVFTTTYNDWELFDDDLGEDLVSTLKSIGYDSAIIYEDDDSGKQVVVWVLFDPKQLKAVYGNLGTYKDSSKLTESYEDWGELTEESKYQGRTVTLNKPFRTPDCPKKFSVYVKNDKGNVVKVNFGDPDMSIKRDDPDRRKSFRARHKCDTQKDKTTPAYWSCRFWSSPKVSDLTK